MRLLANAFLAQLANASAFVRMLNDNAVVRLPLETVVGNVYAAAEGAIVVPGAAIPVSTISAATSNVPRRKASALVVLTQELLRQQSEAESLITRSLRASVALAVDREALAVIMTGVIPMTSTGALLNDVRLLLQVVPLGADSRPYFIAGPDAAVRLATEHTDSQRHFPDAGVLGGSIVGIPLLVSDGLAASTLLFVDAAGPGGNVETLEIALASHAAIEMDSAPTMSAGGGSPSPRPPSMSCRCSRPTPPPSARPSHSASPWCARTRLLPSGSEDRHEQR